MGHLPEQWQHVPTEEYYWRALAWLSLFWTCWRQMEPHVPVILERHPEMCRCDCSCMQHIGRPWGPLSLGPLLVGWTAPESQWLRRTDDGRVQHLLYALVGEAPCCGASLAVEMETGRTCLRRPASGLAVLPEHLRVPFQPVCGPWIGRGMSLMEVAGHFLPHPPVVWAVRPAPAQAEAHPLLAGLLPAVPGVVTGDPARVAAHLSTSLEFHHSARLLTLRDVSAEDGRDVCIGFNPSHIAPGLDATLRACCAGHGFSCKVKAMFSGVPQAYRNDPRVVSVHLYIWRGLYLDESTHAKKPEGFRCLQAWCWIAPRPCMELAIGEVRARRRCSGVGWEKLPRQRRFDLTRGIRCIILWSSCESPHTQSHQPPDTRHPEARFIALQQTDPQ